MEDLGKITGYMCKVSFDYELGLASGGNRIFPSVEDLMKCSPCVESCGIVEVDVSYKRTIQEGRLDKLEKAEVQPQQ